MPDRCSDEPESSNGETEFENREQGLKKSLRGGTLLRIFSLTLLRHLKNPALRYSAGRIAHESQLTNEARLLRTPGLWSSPPGGVLPEFFACICFCVFHTNFRWSGQRRWIVVM